MSSSPSTLRPAVFLDRDGTLNADRGYVCRPEDIRWLPGVAAALARLRWAGYLLIVVTNQSGIARGYYDEQTMQALHDWMGADLRAQGAHIDAFYHCPHHPDLSGACPCRKPAPGLLLRAAEHNETEEYKDVYRSFGDQAKEEGFLECRESPRFRQRAAP